MKARNFRAANRRFEMMIHLANNPPPPYRNEEINGQVSAIFSLEKDAVGEVQVITRGPEPENEDR